MKIYVFLCFFQFFGARRRLRGRMYHFTSGGIERVFCDFHDSFDNFKKRMCDLLDENI